MWLVKFDIRVVQELGHFGAAVQTCGRVSRTQAPPRRCKAYETTPCLVQKKTAGDLRGFSVSRIWLPRDGAQPKYRASAEAIPRKVKALKSCGIAEKTRCQTG